MAAQALEAALAPQRGGLVVGISHEGGTAATLAALDAAAAAGARTAAVTVHPASPIGRFGIVARDGRDRPELVPHDRVPLADPGGRRGRRRAHRRARRRRPGPGARPARRGPGAGGGGRGDRRGARRDARGDRRRVRRRSAGGARARPQDRGGDLAPDDDARPRDVPPRPPAVDGRADRPGPDPRRPRRTGGTLGAGPAGDGGGRPGRRPCRRDPRRRARRRLAGVPRSRRAGSWSPKPRPCPRPVAALVGTATPLQLVTERLARARGTDPDPIRRDQLAYREAATLAD